jgi:hypothetical protein
MARSLPVYIKGSGTSVTASSSAPVATSALSYGQAGIAITGSACGLASAGGKVTLTIRDGDDINTSPVVYQVEFDFTSVPYASDTQAAPIVCFNEPSYTVQADSTANGKGFTFGLSLLKIALLE